jgi:hypothetical protein
MPPVVAPERVTRLTLDAHNRCHALFDVLRGSGGGESQKQTEDCGGKKDMYVFHNLSS